LIDTPVSLLVSCGEFLERAQTENSAQPTESSETCSSECLDRGPTIVYVPTRKETVQLATFLCKSGLRAAAYNAKVFVSYFFLCGKGNQTFLLFRKGTNRKALFGFSLNQLFGRET
jgi:hypothetical protein